MTRRCSKCHCTPLEAIGDAFLSRAKCDDMKPHTFQKTEKTGEPHMTNDNTRDTMNWKPMALFAAITLLGTGAAIVLSQAPLWFGISIGIAVTAGLASLTLAFLHGVKNYKQARGC